jgi:hypothetical protein
VLKIRDCSSVVERLAEDQEVQVRFLPVTCLRKPFLLLRTVRRAVADVPPAARARATAHEPRATNHEKHPEGQADWRRPRSRKPPSASLGGSTPSPSASASSPLSSFRLLERESNERWRFEAYPLRHFIQQPLSRSIAGEVISNTLCTEKIQFSNA